MIAQTYTTPEEMVEESVLSAIMGWPERLDDVVANLNAEMFSSLSCRLLFNALAAMHLAGTQIETLNVRAEMERAGTYERFGGWDRLVAIERLHATSANLEHHVKLMAEAHRRRRFNNMIEKAARMGADKTADVGSIAATLQNSLLEITVRADGPGYRPLSYHMIKELEQLEERGKATLQGKTLGVVTGFPEIDDEINGFQPGELVTIFAGPKAGKSALAMAIAMHTSTYGGGCGFVCAEMTGEQLSQRVLKAEANLSARESAHGISDPERFRHVVELSKAIISPGNFFVDDEAFPELDDVIARGLALKAKHPSIEAIFVDYLQLVSKRMKGRRGDEELAEVAKGLKGLAKKAGVVVVAPGQTNYKQVDARQNPKPELRDVQGGSGPAQTSDFLFLLSRPNPTDPSNDFLNLELAASRRTARFETQLNWDGQHMRVTSRRKPNN